MNSALLYESDFDLTEIINGEEVMGPSPLRAHQRVVFELSYAMGSYAKERGFGEVDIAPLDVILEEGMNRLQPDIIFIRKENLSIAQDWIRGVPDLVVEVVSRGSVARDTVTKKDIYEHYGVEEYWLVFAELECIEVFVLDGGRYGLFSVAEGEGTVRSRVLEGFEVAIANIFR
ncbi:Uma2 family endonuclease [Candidatus Magnetobacterium casense]|uniref:Uma2 family endonuclease n=1 Tax=Candidatus Magnetobacterium casense TaxID=1455061 RepID=A0ABS6S1H8_9BACT|nr:Uma2 family endonuclease [Candidatus Magnetobacterium casensis]MBV6342707.1 Uma2 family endonuclease [Candidatus Magnetobacterium casensis]